MMLTSYIEAAIRSRDDLQEIAIRVLEVDPAPAVVVVDFAHFVVRGVGPVREPSLANACEDAVKLALADE
jgi:hypothetical protein